MYSELEQPTMALANQHAKSHLRADGEDLLQTSSTSSSRDRVTKEEIKNPFEKGSHSEDGLDSRPWGVDAEQKLYEEAKFLNDAGMDLDDEVDLVAEEFLSMLDLGFSPGGYYSDDDPDSPRGRLLKQFERDSLFADAFDSGEAINEDGHPEAFHSTSSSRKFGWTVEPEYGLLRDEAASELQKATQADRSKSRAKEMEDEEAAALMQKWGLNEKALQNSPLMSRSGKPVMGPQVQPTHTFGRSSGSVIQLEDGGSLMPNVSKNRACGSLAMQVSKPVVVPSTMGSTAVDVLRHLASVGTETLAKEAMAAMPLADVAGKMEEIAALARSKTKHGDRQPKPGHYEDFVSLEDLAPLAIKDIEALAFDGLRIQADMSEEEAPSYLDAAAWGMADKFTRQDNEGIRVAHDVAGMRFENLQECKSLPGDVKDDGPLSMALTLEEWAKLDAGILGDEAKSKDRSMALLAAHNGQLVGKDTRKGQSRKQGNMGSTLMIAMLVQLRDPLQNFEPVGAPMMALVQAERVMLPPIQPKVGRNVSMRGNSEVDDAATPSEQKEEAPHFKLAGVHLSGLKSVDNDEASLENKGEPQKRGWGSQKQLQAGSRWLSAQGMSKGSKQSLLKPKAAPSLVKASGGETLWSISARSSGKGRDAAASNRPMRNPDVMFTKATTKRK